MPTKPDASTDEGASRRAEEGPAAEVVRLAPRRRPVPRPVASPPQGGEDDPGPGPSAA